MILLNFYSWVPVEHGSCLILLIIEEIVALLIRKSYCLTQLQAHYWCLINVFFLINGDMRFTYLVLK